MICTPGELKKEILLVAASADGDFLLLGQLLRRLHEIDQSKFQQFIKRANLGTRKAYYLIELAEQLGGIRLPRKRLQAIGWTKAQIIAKHINRHNALALLKLADQHNTRDLTLLMQGSESPPWTRCVLMYFSLHQYRVFEKAIVQHGGVRRGRGLVNKEQALVRLISRASS